VGVALVVVCVAACSGTPLAAQTAPVGATPVGTPVATPGPTLMPTAESTLAPTAVPTAAPVVGTSDAAALSAAPGTAAPDTTANDAGVGQGTAADSGAAQATAALASCDPNAPPPLPLPRPGTGAGAAQGFFRNFRDPLPPAPLFDPPGPKRVGLQAGHWLVDQVPAELRGLQAGATGGGKQEWQVNLDVAQRTAALLEASGIQTDVLPSTVPAHYQVNAFVALHADGDPSGADRGFKVARPGFSSIPDVDDRLVDAINQVYGAETELPRDDEHISLRMRYYYAFNSRRYCHAVAPGVPQAIVEMAYVTNATDRQYLIGDPLRLARALADGIQAFLATTP
jgi:N-acetylmuramoyl-L-alanine amidase-like protein